MDIKKLAYPNKSHRKLICIPPESINLAEFLGIEIGDGGINNPWQVVITLNAEKDSEYAEYVAGLTHDLFGIDAVMRIRKPKVLRIVISSISLVDFLVEKGAMRGNKVMQHITVPGWILKNMEYKKAFVKGLVDTDGCLYVHRHRVGGVRRRNIGFCFTSASLDLLKPVAEIFCEFGIEPHITDGGQRIYLYSENSVVKYLSTFGTANPRISNVYNNWKGAGVV